jgi:hypothetical protein
MLGDPYPTRGFHSVKGPLGTCARTSASIRGQDRGHAPAHYWCWGSLRRWFERESVEPTLGFEPRTCCLRMWTLTVLYGLLRATLARIADIDSPVCHPLLRIHTPAGVSAGVRRSSVDAALCHGFSFYRGMANRQLEKRDLGP